MAQGKSIPGRFREFRAQVDAIALAVLRKASTRFQQKMQARLRGPTGPNTLRSRTRALARSVASTVTKIPNGYRLTFKVGANAPYAIVHEEGRIITAKKAKNLAIPLPAALNASGVARLASPRQMPELILLITRSGKKLLVKPVGPRVKKGTADFGGRIAGTRITLGPGRFVPWYVLKYSVRIPARLGFRKEARGVAREAFAELRQQFAQLAGRRRSS